MPKLDADPEMPLDPSSLDPADWDAFRRLAHSALDDAIDYVRDVRRRPVWQALPEDVKQRLNEPLPAVPQGIENTYRNFRELVLPYATGNIHPRFWGWVHGTGLTTGIISEMLAAAMNSNCGGRDHGALYVERKVVDWCRQIVGYPDSASGLMVSGTSMGTLIGLAVARNAATGGSVRAGGVAKTCNSFVTYASSEAHSSLARALELLGLGHNSLHRIVVDDSFAINPVALRQAIHEDRRAGRRPFCVVGCAGTVNTGAIDNLTMLTEICESEKLWFHVDAAFAGLCALRGSLAGLLQGIERSDSVSFDFHKWMYIQYDAGCVLVRDGRLHKNTFATRPDYLQHWERGLAGGGEWFTDFGPELSRGFRALKVWFALKTYGTEKFGEMIEKNIQQARYLAQLVKSNPMLELLAPPTLNIVCFRYRGFQLENEELDSLNRDIVAELQIRGIAAPSTTCIHGKLSIRVAITNHRSRREDFDLLVNSVIMLAKERCC